MSNAVVTDWTVALKKLEILFAPKAKLIPSLIALAPSNNLATVGDMGKLWSMTFNHLKVEYEWPQTPAVLQ